MSHLSPRRTLQAARVRPIAAASTLAAAAVVGAPAAHAADPPVITGISAPWVYGGPVSESSVTISGSGFTGATAVTATGFSEVRSFNVESDHTITVTLSTGTGGGVSSGAFAVTADGQTSAPTPLAEFRLETFPPTNTVSVAMQCSLGDDAFAAKLSTNFVYDGVYPIIVVPEPTGTLYIPEPYKPRQGSAVPLGEFRTALTVDGSVSAGPIARLSGTGTVTSVETDVTGAVESTLDLAAATSPAATFPIPSSVDGNPLGFGSGNLSSTTLHTLPSEGPLSIALKSYRAQLGLVAGGTASLDCAPSSTFRTLSSFSPLPAVTPTPTPTVTPTVTPTPTPTVTPSPTPVPGEARFKASGTTTISTITKGTLPLTGGLRTRVDAAGTALVEPALTLNDTQGRLTVLGFLPVTASLGFVPSGAATGSFANQQLSLTSKFRIKVKSVKAFGAIPLAGGNTCQTKSLTNLALTSDEGGFSLASGGVLSGTFKISDLNGCGVFGGLVSSAVAGGGNAMRLSLTPAT